MAQFSFDPDSVEFPTANLIAGRRCNGDGTEYEVHRPSDGKLVRSEFSASAMQVDEAVTAAKSAYRQSGWADLPPRQKQRILRRWADLVDEHQVEISRLECAVSVRVIGSVAVRDARIAGEIIRFFSECIDKVEGSVLATAPDRHSVLVHEPHGVVAGIAPWNTPMLLSLLKIAPAVAAGNSIVLKASETTPYATVRVVELGIEAGLPKGLISIVTGYGTETGTALVRHSDVNFISFTGSGTTGARVMSDAALSGIKPVSLELGGKSPQLVFADAPDLDDLAVIIANSVCANAGQVCFAGTRLVVEDSIREELVAKIEAHMNKAIAGATWDDRTTLGPIVSAKQGQRFEQLLAEAVSEGATIRCGGRRIDAVAGGVYFAPTIIENASPNNPAVRQEFFGPALTVQPFHDEAEGLALADHPTFGLAGAVHTKDIRKALRAVRSIQAGTVWVNTYGPNPEPNAPMGGYKQSGFGKDFGILSLDKFFKTKHVAIQI